MNLTAVISDELCIILYYVIRYYTIFTIAEAGAVRRPSAGSAVHVISRAVDYIILILLHTTI